MIRRPRVLLLAFTVLTLVAGGAARRLASQQPAGPQVRANEPIPEFVGARCGRCHAVPQPSMLGKDQWTMTITEFMKSVMPRKAGVEYTDQELRTVLAYYRANSPQRLPKLPPDPVGTPIRFRSEGIGDPPSKETGMPTITNVNLVDFDQDGRLDVLVCEGARNRVSWIRRTAKGWVEEEIGEAPAPAHAEVFDLNGDGHLDVVVAALGSLFPNDDPVGEVVLMINDGKGGFTARTVLEGVGRVADVQPGDFDGDGDVDFAVGLFGQIREGGVGWLQQGPAGEFAFQMLRPKPGVVHVPTADLDGDGKLDFVALITQESEEIVAFLGDGKGAFRQRVLYLTGTPLYGSSGIQLVDLDQDGDQDILYTNGDSFDLVGSEVPSYFLLRPYHGVEWLENLGNLRFERHDIRRFYGAFRAAAGDLDEDGDLDILVVSMFNDWLDAGRQSIIWLENDGEQRFTAHGIANSPSHLVTAALGDLDGDGRLDAVTGGMHVIDPFDRIGRVTFWHNQGRSAARP